MQVVISNPQLYSVFYKWFQFKPFERVLFLIYIPNPFLRSFEITRFKETELIIFLHIFFLL